MKDCFYFYYPFKDGTKDAFYAPLDLYDGQTVHYGYIRPDGTREPPTAELNASYFFELCAKGHLRLDC